MATAEPTLKVMRIMNENAREMRAAIRELERFTGVTGELAHFLRAGDRLDMAITAKALAGWFDQCDIPSLRAELVNRVHRSVLTFVQCEENTVWGTLKEKLKRAYGGGRWAPEEDVVTLIRERRGSRQSAGSYAAVILAGYNKIVDKLSEQLDPAEVTQHGTFLGKILKAQLRREVGRTIAADKGFAEAAQEMMEEGEKELEAERGDEGWKIVKPKRGWSSASPNNREYSPRPREDGGKPRRTPGITRVERNPPRRRERVEDKRCYECGRRGHLAAQCERTKCFECNTPGHVARHCPFIKRGARNAVEPMEVNVQRLRTNRRGRTPTPDEGHTTEEEAGEMGEREDQGSESGEQDPQSSGAGRKRAPWYRQ